MSTTAVIPSNDTVAAMPIKKENILFAVVFAVDETGSPKRDAKGVVMPPRHTSSENDIKALEAADYLEKTPADKRELIAFKQVVVKPSAGTLEGYAQLITDPDEQLNIINKGIASKFNQKIRTKLIEQNEDGTLVFQPTDGSYDATELVQEVTQRVSLSPTDKALKALSSLSPENLAAVMAQFQAIAAAQAAASQS
jgi:hypothetical protein